MPKAKTKIDKHALGTALQDALNASFNFGVAHAAAMAAGAEAQQAHDEAMTAAQSIASLIIPREKKDLN